MAPLEIFMIVLFAGFLAFIVLLGVFYPGSGAAQLDWKPTRSPDTEVELELRDVQEMLEAKNVRRRARGQAELTEDVINERVRNDRREADERRAAYLADIGADVDEEDARQLLELRNARRRRRGQPELTLDEVKASLAGPVSRRSPDRG